MKQAGDTYLEYKLPRRQFRILHLTKPCELQLEDLNVQEMARNKLQQTDTEPSDDT